jgi:hypothetical protein
MLEQRRFTNATRHDCAVDPSVPEGLDHTAQLTHLDPGDVIRQTGQLGERLSFVRDRHYDDTCGPRGAGEDQWKAAVPGNESNALHV